jgi:hypothetical protein
MDRISAPPQNAALGLFADILRRAEMGAAGGPEFLPKGLDVMNLVRQLALPSPETMEKLSYGDPLFRMPTQSNIPITTDRGYVAEVLGMAPAVPAAARATTRLSNQAADALVRAITRNPEATAPAVLEAAGQMAPLARMFKPEQVKKILPETKIVDESGNPKLMYHGTREDFEQFEPGKRNAVFASPDPEFTNAYAGELMGEFQSGGNVRPVYVNTKKPFDYDNPDHVRQMVQYIKKNDPDFADIAESIGEKVQGGKYFEIERPLVQNAIRELGFDGFFVKELGTKNIAVFDPSQIKSATSDPAFAGLLEPEAAYRGSHTAPNAEKYGATLDSLEGIMPADVYSSRGKRLYGLGNSDVDAEWFAAAFKAKGKPDAEVTVYRAVPKGVKDINSGDWVTTSKTYADMHGGNTIGDEYEILSKKVKAKTLSSEGYPYEFGYNE